MQLHLVLITGEVVYNKVMDLELKLEKGYQLLDRTATGETARTRRKRILRFLYNERYLTRKGLILRLGMVPGAYSTRWDISEDGNCHCQCWACNYNHVRDQYPYFTWYISIFGPEKLEKLRRKFKGVKKYKTWQLIELYDHLERVTKSVRCAI